MTEKQIRLVQDVVRKHNRNHAVHQRICALREVDGISVWMRQEESFCYGEIFAPVVMYLDLDVYIFHSEKRGVHLWIV